MSMKRIADPETSQVCGASRGRHWLVIVTAGTGTLLAIAAVLFFARKAPDPPAPSQSPHGALIDPLPQTNPAASTNFRAPGMALVQGQPNPQPTVPLPAVWNTIPGYAQVGFEILADFPAGLGFEVINSNTPAAYSARTLTNPIPGSIKAWDGKDVAVRGFMLPMKQENGRVTEFLLLRNQSMCCFGKPPNINEWVHVTMTGKGVPSQMDQVVTVYGTLHVGEHRVTSQMLDIYRLDGDGVSFPAQF
jgi:hypothetical protein